MNKAELVKKYPKLLDFYISVDHDHTFNTPRIYLVGIGGWPEDSIFSGTYTRITLIEHFHTSAEAQAAYPWAPVEKTERLDPEVMPFDYDGRA